MVKPGEYDQRKAAFGMLKGPKRTEANLQKNVCKYLRLAYGHRCRFTSHFGGVRLSQHQGEQLKATYSHTGHPDLTIYSKAGTLFIELKKIGSGAYLKGGRLRAGEHIKSQSDYIDFLNGCPGVWAYFAEGFDEAKAIIDRFFNDEF